MQTLIFLHKAYLILHKHYTISQAFIILNRIFVSQNHFTMRFVPFLNSLLIVGFLAVVSATVLMMASTGYNDKVSHTVFILHAANGFLLLARAAFKTEEQEA